MPAENSFLLPPGFSNPEDEDSFLKKLKHWLPVLLLALLLHGAAMLSRSTWLFKKAVPPPPVELRTVDPAKLDALKKAWAREQAKSLILNQDKSLPKEKDPPRDAKYFSDRNTHVEKEQRARNTDVMPQKAQQAGAAPSQATRPMPKLSDLGIKMPLPKPQGAGSTTSPRFDQSLRDRDLPEGNQNLLNTQESVYYAFYARMYEAIGPNWQSRIRSISYRRRVSPGDYTTVVDVVLDAKGDLLGINVLQSSGISEFDDAVRATLEKISHFANPPHGLLDAHNQIHTGWTFTVNVGSGFGMDYQPPERAF